MKRESVWKQRNLGIVGDVVSCLYEFYFHFLELTRMVFVRQPPVKCLLETYGGCKVNGSKVAKFLERERDE